MTLTNPNSISLNIVLERSLSSVRQLVALLRHVRLQVLLVANHCSISDAKSSHNAFLTFCDTSYPFLSNKTTRFTLNALSGAHLLKI